jgi:hypothetical protein
MKTKKLIVTFLARGKRYGKWKKFQMSEFEIDKMTNPDDLSESCIEFAKGYFKSDYVEIQSISKKK